MLRLRDTLKKVHEGTDQVREGKMDLLQEELEHFAMNDDETMTQIYERLMVLASDIASLGSTEWDDHKVTKKFLRAFTPINSTLATMIRGDPKFKTKIPNQLLGEILHQELVERDVAKSLSHKVNTNVSFNVTPCLKVDSSSKAPKSKKAESSNEGSTDEEMALVMRIVKSFMKKKSSQRRCYECRSWAITLLIPQN